MKRPVKLGECISVGCWVVACGFGLVACDSGSDAAAGGDELTDCEGGKCDSLDANGFKHKWAIDMKKVRTIRKYDANPRFVAASQAEAKVPEPIFAAACEKEKIIGQAAADGSYPVSDGGCFLWGNTMKRNYDHSKHVDDPAQKPIINIIDEQGNKLDPPGYLNIIAMKNAERDQQDEIRGYLRNGDILVYFHPEHQNLTQHRMEHAAMYYDTGQGPLAINLGGKPFVHHVDNPVSYGPPFNSGVSTVPFHVFRFHPNGAPNVGPRDGNGRYQFKCTDEIRDAGGPPECQSGAATFTISDDLSNLYGYTARNWAFITNGHAPFAGFHSMTWPDAYKRGQASQTVTAATDLFAGPALARQYTPSVYCAGLVFTNLNLAMNRPLHQAGLGADNWNKFTTSKLDFSDSYLTLGQGGARGALTYQELTVDSKLPRLGRLLVEPITATDLLDEWLNGYYAKLPVQARAQILQGSAQQISSEFTVLSWVDGKQGSLASSAVSSPQNIAAYAEAYAEGGDKLKKFKEDELKNVKNRYIPPPMYYWLALREDSLLSYVGTVIHVDLLAAINGNSGGGGGGGNTTEYMEGGPDTSLYENYSLLNGKRKANRILEPDSGPAKIGYGSQITMRITAADVRDLVVVLHPAGSFTAFDDPRACNNNRDCIGNAPGLPLPIDPAKFTANALDNATISWDLFKPVAEGGAGCVKDANGARTCPAFDWATMGPSASGRFTLDKVQGQWTMTVLDRGQYSEAATLPNCVECATGGGHLNQWSLKIRDDAANGGGGGGTQTPCLTISEYIEGTSNNRGVELLNCGTTDLDLTQYSLCVVSNSATSCSGGIALRGSLASRAVHKVCHPSISASVFAVSSCNQSSTLLNFNGDDRLLLKKGTLVVDAFGKTAQQPSASTWKDMTLRRINPAPYLGQDAFTTSVYFKQFPVNDFSNFGTAP